MIRLVCGAFLLAFCNGSAIKNIHRQNRLGTEATVSSDGLPQKLASAEKAVAYAISDMFQPLPQDDLHYIVVTIQVKDAVDLDDERFPKKKKIDGVIEKWLTDELEWTKDEFAVEMPSTYPYEEVPYFCHTHENDEWDSTRRTLNANGEDDGVCLDLAVQVHDSKDLEKMKEELRLFMYHSNTRHPKDVFYEEAKFEGKISDYQMDVDAEKSFESSQPVVPEEEEEEEKPEEEEEEEEEEDKNDKDDEEYDACPTEKFCSKSKWSTDGFEPDCNKVSKYEYEATAPLVQCTWNFSPECWESLGEDSASPPVTYCPGPSVNTEPEEEEEEEEEKPEEEEPVEEEREDEVSLKGYQVVATIHLKHAREIKDGDVPKLKNVEKAVDRHLEKTFNSTQYLVELPENYFGENPYMCNDQEHDDDAWESARNTMGANDGVCLDIRVEVSSRNDLDAIKDDLSDYMYHQDTRHPTNRFHDEAKFKGTIHKYEIDADKDEYFIAEAVMN